MHVDLLFIVPFTREFSLLTPDTFFRRYVVDGTGVSEVIVGYDHMFGRQREAGVEELLAMGKHSGFSVFATHPVMVNGVTVSSTGIREALLRGDVAAANELLGYAYAMHGYVVRGDGRGKSLGYPTANIALTSRRKLVPARGVYLVGVVLEGRQMFGMMNIGVRPTVDATGVMTMEVHVLDLHRDIYGEEVAITFHRRLRDELRFASFPDLVSQLDRDREESLKYVELLKRGV